MQARRLKEESRTPESGRRLVPLVNDQPAVLQQGGYTPFLIKVHNESTVTAPMRIASPQALPIFSGGKRLVRDADKDKK